MFFYILPRFVCRAGVLLANCIIKPLVTSEQDATVLLRMTHCGRCREGTLDTVVSAAQTAAVNVACFNGELTQITEKTNN